MDPRSYSQQHSDDNAESSRDRGLLHRQSAKKQRGQQSYACCEPRVFATLHSVGSDRQSSNAKGGYGKKQNAPDRQTDPANQGNECERSNAGWFARGTGTLSTFAFGPDQ
jgi:hypothetical protein